MSSTFEIDVKNRIANYELNLQNFKKLNDQQQNNISMANFQLKKRTQEYKILEDKYRALYVQNQNLQRTYSSLEVTFKNKIEGEVVQRYSQYEDTIGRSNQQKA